MAVDMVVTLVEGTAPGHFRVFMEARDRVTDAPFAGGAYDRDFGLAFPQLPTQQDRYDDILRHLESEVAAWKRDIERTIQDLPLLQQVLTGHRFPVIED